MEKFRVLKLSLVTSNGNGPSRVESHVSQGCPLIFCSLSLCFVFTDWMLAFRVVIPTYMVMALSQFVTYLLILIVGEKEKKIKEGMKIMGLRDSVFW